MVLPQRKREHLFFSIENQNIVRLDPGRVHLPPLPLGLTKPIFFPQLMVPKQRGMQILHPINHTLFLPEGDTSTSHHQLSAGEIVS